MPLVNMTGGVDVSSELKLTFNLLVISSQQVLIA